MFWYLEYSLLGTFSSYVISVILNFSINTTNEPYLMPQTKQDYRRVFIQSLSKPFLLVLFFASIDRCDNPKKILNDKLIWKNQKQSRVKKLPKYKVKPNYHFYFVLFLCFKYPFYQSVETKFFLENLH